MKKETKSEYKWLINIAMNAINVYWKTEVNNKYIKWLTYPPQPKKRVLAKLGELKEILDVTYAGKNVESSDGQKYSLSLMTLNLIVSDLCYDAQCHKDLTNFEATHRIEQII